MGIFKSGNLKNARNHPEGKRTRAFVCVHLPLMLHMTGAPAKQVTAGVVFKP